MYVLLPGDMGVSFLDFLPSYLMAQVAVVLTHIPGGVGVFELVILHLTHTSHEQMVFAAVLLFRLIYYIIPLLPRRCCWPYTRPRQRRHMLREAGRWLSVLSHSIAAYTAFVGGLILLVSSTLPTLPHSVPCSPRICPKVRWPWGTSSALFPAPLCFFSPMDWSGGRPAPSSWL